MSVAYQITATGNTPFAPEPGLVSSWNIPNGGWTYDDFASLVSWGYLPEDLQDAGSSGSADFGGIRECHLFEENIGGAPEWFLFYGAGDGTNTTSGEWRIQLATSTNRGISWTKRGPINIGLGNGAGTAPVSRDMLWMGKFAGSYWIFAMKGEGASTASALGRVPGLNYESDIWTMPDAGSGPVGTWTYCSGSNLTVGTGIESQCATLSCMLRDGLNSFLSFYSQSGTGGYNLSTASQAALGGPFTKTGSSLFANNSDVRENPKVFFHNFMNCWVMLNNEDSTASSSGVDTQNVMYTSRGLTSWDHSTRIVLNHTSAMDGPTCVGIGSPIYMPDGLARQTSDGYVPFSYDGFPLGSSNPGSQVGRKGLYGVLEPSKGRFRYTPTGEVLDYEDPFAGTDGTDIHAYSSNWEYTTEHSSGITIESDRMSLGSTAGQGGAINLLAQETNPIIQALVIQSVSCGVDWIFRAQDTGDYYLLDVTVAPGTNDFTGTLYKCVSGTFTAIAGQSAINMGAGIVDTEYAGQVTVLGQSFTFSVNGVALHTFTDSSNTYTTAGYCGMRNGDAGTGDRLVDNFTVLHTGAGDTARGAWTAELNGDFVGEFSVDLIDSFNSGSYLGFDFRTQDSAGQNGYRLVVNTGGGTQLFKVTSGSAASLATSGGTQTVSFGEPCRVRVKTVGATIQAWLNGELQINYTDSSSPYLTGAFVGLFAFNNNFGVRNLVLYSSDTVTITGLSPGMTLCCRAPGGPPVNVRTASGASASITLSHYPFASVDVNGQDMLIPGNVWGGATLALSSPSAAFGARGRG